MYKDDNDMMNELYNEHAAKVFIPPVETDEKLIAKQDSGDVLDMYFSRGGTKASVNQKLVQEKQTQQQEQFLTEEQKVNHHLDAAIANLRCVAPLYESIDTQSYFQEIIDAIRELKQ